MAVKKSVKILIGGCGCFSVLFGLGLAVLIYLGFNTMPTHVSPGELISKKHLAALESLDLVDPTETILYYYSDAIMDIKESVYLLTDKRLVLHNEVWNKPTWKIQFKDIDSVEIQRDESFFVDSYVSVTLINGEDVSFPLSSENELDLAFLNKLQQFIDGIEAH